MRLDRHGMSLLRPVMMSAMMMGVVAVLVGLLAACQPAQKKGPVADTKKDMAIKLDGGQPSWFMNHRHSSYPESRFFLGVGSSQNSNAGRAVEAARLNAVADILQQFEVQVNRTVTSFVSEKLRETDKVRQTELLERASTYLKSTVQGTLRAIQLADQKYNPSSGEAYVLIVVDHKDLIESLQDKIKVLDATVRVALGEAEDFSKKGNPFGARSKFREAEEALIQSQVIVSQARFTENKSAVVEKGSVKLADTASFEQILVRRREQEKRVQLYLVVDHQVEGITASQASASPEDVEKEIFRALKSCFNFKVVRATSRFSGMSAEDIVDDFDLLRKKLSSGKNHGLVLVCHVTTSKTDLRSELLSVRSSGWARLIDLNRQQLLISAAVTENDDPEKYINTASYLRRLVQGSAKGSARMLALEMCAQE